MKLIYAKGACSLSVHIMLEEMEVGYQSICVRLEDKTVLNTYNPLGYVPAIILDRGEVLTEAVAILEYLTDIQNGARFMPRSAVEKTRCREWLAYTSTELHQKMWPLFHSSALGQEFKRELLQRGDARFAYNS